jgi:peptide/nickel transport system substrate-binding protein
MIRHGHARLISHAVLEEVVAMPRPLSTTCTALVAGTVLFAATACSAGIAGSAGGPADARKQITIGLAAEPANLDFTRTDGAAIAEVLLVNVYEGLVKIDESTGRIVPLLAKSWTVSPDRKSYTFTLRDNATFSNGDRFDASTVKFSIERAKSDAWTISLKKYMDVVDGVEILSPTEAKVNLKEPSNDWLFRMTTRIGAMFSIHGVGDLANKPVGTGPYVLEKWTRGDSILLRANGRYWGTKPKLETVTVRYFKDPTAMKNALTSGGIDVIGTLQSPESLPGLSANHNLRVIEGTTNGELTLSFNNSRPPLNNKLVRQAIKYAINHQAVLQTAYAGHGTLIGSMVPPTDPWYEDLTGLYPYDPQKAKQLLAEAGRPKLALKFRIPNLPYAVSAAQVVKSQLDQVGITADIDVLEFPARWLDVVFKKADYDMSLISHVEARDIATFADPTYYWRYDNPRVQELLAAAETGDKQAEIDNMKQLARTLAEDAAADWLFLLPNIMVADQDVAGLPKNLVGEALDLTALSRS